MAVAQGFQTCFNSHEKNEINAPGYITGFAGQSSESLMFVSLNFSNALLIIAGKRWVLT